MILVAGATGNLGSEIVRRLRERGEEVRALVRNTSAPEKTARLKELGVETVTGNLRDRASLDVACRGVRTVISTVTTIATVQPGDSFADTDAAGTSSLIDAAKKAGVEHFVYTSVVGASPDHPIDFWRTKARVERYLEDSGMAFTIIRPTAFIDMHAYQLIGKSVIEGKRVMLFGKGRNPRNFVAAEDVAKAINGALQLPGLRGQAIDMGGPENLTAHQVVETFEKVSRRKVKVTHLPLAVVRAMARAIKPVHPGISRVMKIGIVAETTDQTFDPSQFSSQMPIRLTTLEEWIRNRLPT